MENRETRFAKNGVRMFGVRVRDLRRARGWTQDDLAKRMTSAGYPMHQTTVTKMESGARPTSVEEMFALAAVFNMPVPEFFQSEEDAEIRLEIANLHSELAILEVQAEEVVRREGELRARMKATQARSAALEQRLKDRMRAARRTNRENHGEHPETS